MTPLDPVSATLLLAVIVEPLGDLAAAIFFAYLFWISKVEPVPGSERTFTSRLLRNRSWLLGLLCLKSIVVTVVFSFIGWIAIARIRNTPVEGASPFVILALIVLGALPIMFMFAFWRTRRGKGTPPPFNGND